MTPARVLVLWLGLAVAFARQLGASPSSPPMERVHYFRSSDGTTLAYFEKGSGPPVVLLAGGYALAHGYLSPIGDALAVAHRVILPDQRGTGLSKLVEYNRTTVNLEKLVADLETLRTHLGLRKLNLLGHSWGGMLAMSYAVAHPNRVESIVLVGSGGMDLAFMPLHAAGAAARLKIVLTSEEQRRLDALMAGAGPTPMSEQTKSEISHLRSAAVFHDRKRAEEMAKYFDTDPINESAAAAILADLKERNWNVRPTLRNLHAKVLIIHGLDDPMPLSVSQDIQQAVPGAKLEVIDDCGHYPWLDRPVRFFSILNGFGSQWKVGVRER
jgi:proline iminopeptidase